MYTTLKINDPINIKIIEPSDKKMHILLPRLISSLFGFSFVCNGTWTWFGVFSLGRVWVLLSLWYISSSSSSISILNRGFICNGFWTSPGSSPVLILFNLSSFLTVCGTACSDSTKNTWCESLESRLRLSLNQLIVWKTSRKCTYFLYVCFTYHLWIGISCICACKGIYILNLWMVGWTRCIWVQITTNST